MFAWAQPATTRWPRWTRWAWAGWPTASPTTSPEGNNNGWPSPGPWSATAPSSWADEPTGALDTLTGESVLRLLRRHCEDGGSVVLVTHEAGHAAWADRVVFLRDGSMVAQAGPAPGPEQLLAGGRR